MNHHRGKLFADASARLIPLSVVLEITHRCTYRCRHCYIPNLDCADGISTPRLLRLLDEMAELGTLYLAVSGGEPLVRRDWREILHGARDRGFDVRLLSNGSLISRKVAKELADLDVAVELTMHAMTPEIFENMTRIPGSFGRTKRAAELLAAHGVGLKLKASVVEANLNEVAAVAEFAQLIGADFFADPRILHCKNGDVSPLSMQIPLGDLEAFYRSEYSPFSRPEPESVPPDREPCSAARRSCNVTASGDVLACQVMPVSAGNINFQSFQDIWYNSPQFATLRSVTVKDLKRCNACPKLSYCGRCPAQALVSDGDILGPSSWACAHAAALEKAFEND